MYVFSLTEISFRLKTWTDNKLDKKFYDVNLVRPLSNIRFPDAADDGWKPLTSFKKETFSFLDITKITMVPESTSGSKPNRWQKALLI